MHGVGKRYEVPHSGSPTTQKGPQIFQEAVNSASLTLSDESYLEKKALAWGLRYKK
jgi:hypothetical protein